jgi:PAS domain S-box-containing protein
MADENLQAENEELRRRLEEAEETIRAIRDGAVDGFVVEEPEGHRIYTLEGADRPYRLLIERMQQGAATLQADGTIAYCNQSLAELLGVPSEKLMGTMLRHFVAADDDSAYGDLLRQGRVRLGRGEVRLRQPDGKLVPVHITLNVLPKDAGAAIGALVTDLTAQKHQEQLALAHEALRQSERELSDFFESASIGLHWIGPDGIILRVNQAELDMLGYSKDEYLGRHTAEFHVDQAVIEDVLSRLARGEILRECPARLRCKDGSIRDVLINSNVLFVNDQFIHARCFTTDITERRAAEEALRESEERHRTLASVLTDVPWTTDPEGNFVTPQHAYARYTGKSWEQLRGLGWAQCIHPDDREQLVRIWRRAVATRTTYDAPCREWHGPTQQWRHVIARGTPVLNADGSVREWVGSLTDVEEQHRAQQSLRESEGRFRMLADSSPVLMWQTDSTGVVFVNGPYLGFFGQTFEGVAGMRWAEYLHPEDHDAYVAAYRSAFEMQAGYEFQCRFRRHDGEYRWLHNVGSPHRDAYGAFRGFVGCSADVTDMKRAELALEEARDQAEAGSRAKDRFLAVLSHELRTPLTPVMMTVAAMDMNPDLAPALRTNIAMIRRNVELEIKLIDDLLDLSRVTAGKLRLNKESVEVISAVQHVCETCRPFILEKSIRLQCHMPREKLFVSADPARLQQVLWNLVKNAVKFTPDRGDIHVTISGIGDGRVLFEVRDTGIGIPAEVLPRIFDAFEQGDAKITRQFGGMGLGLAISRALVEMHGGTIRAQSAGQDRGATFTVELPLLPAEQVPPSRPEQSGGEGNTATKFRVLVVEDHADSADVLAMLLGESGYAVKTANSAAAALALAAKEPFDVMVSDIGLPDATGYDLMKQIKERHNIKGIAMSGYGMDEDLRKSREAGFSDHIVKPPNVAQIERSIRRIVG